MDFVHLLTQTKGNKVRVYPSFQVLRSQDMMLRGGEFYALYNPDTGLWETNIYDALERIDRALAEKAEEARKAFPDVLVSVEFLRDYSTGHWEKFRRCIKSMDDNFQTLDRKVIFANQETAKEDHISFKLPYDIAAGPTPNYDKLVTTLYSPEELQKLEWALGSVIAGKSSKIQKFIAIYGKPGAGKSTYLNIIENLFTRDHITTFDAKKLLSDNEFGAATVAENTLIGIQHDANLSQVQEKSIFNSIVAHEPVRINRKYQNEYTTIIQTMLFVATNEYISVGDKNSGLLRRLIDVEPSGALLPQREYDACMDGIKFEYGAIAHKCLEVFYTLGEKHYDDYRSDRMSDRTNFWLYLAQTYYRERMTNKEYTTLDELYDYYRSMSADNPRAMVTKLRLRGIMEDYFGPYHKEWTNPVNGNVLYDVYTEIQPAVRGEDEGRNYTASEPEPELLPSWLELKLQTSMADAIFKDVPAQYANDDRKPTSKWDHVHTVLGDLDTTKTHFVNIDTQYIIFDIDGKDPLTGERSFERCLEKAKTLQPTYAEVSSSGKGLHLIYKFMGDPDSLSDHYDDEVEIKVYKGNASWRRRVRECNDHPIATKVLEPEMLKPNKTKVKKGEEFEVKNEQMLRAMIRKALSRGYHRNTTPNVSYILRLIELAVESGISYDIRDMRSEITTFASGSTNQKDACLRQVKQMKFVSEDILEKERTESKQDNRPIVFFDTEVGTNFFGIAWKFAGHPKEKTVIWKNPPREDVRALINNNRLIGFNNKTYDNHILYAWAELGYNNQELGELSKALITSKDMVGPKSARFVEAWNLSYCDVWNVATFKRSLKEFQIDLDLDHVEMEIDWDAPIPEERWDELMEYCRNDTFTTEQVMEHIEVDYNTRKMLAALTDSPINTSTNKLAQNFIFEGKKPDLVYTDLSQQFPGYSYDIDEDGRVTSHYKGERVNEGGFVYAEPGYYENVLVLDVASMHPTSMIELNYLGSKTQRFKELMEARLAIKHGNVELAGTLLNGTMKPYLQEENLGALANALKIVINSVYGCSSMKSDHPLKHRKNVDNIVAKRGSLFMVDLKHFVESMGLNVVHIKTDSIKLENPSQEVIDAVVEFGAKYGYTFEVENKYDRFCLVNNAVYIARDADTKKWSATGKQFAEPYIFKKLFSQEEIELVDLAQKKMVKGRGRDMYLDMNPEDTPMALEKDLVFVGSGSKFLPVKDQHGGHLMVRTKSEFEEWRDTTAEDFVPEVDDTTLIEENEDSWAAVAGTKGWRWMKYHDVVNCKWDDWVDMTYFDHILDEARISIERFVSIEEFTRA